MVNVAGEEDEEGEVKLSLADEELLADLTYDELKQAFRFIIILSVSIGHFHRHLRHY